MKINRICAAALSSVAAVALAAPVADAQSSSAHAVRPQTQVPCPAGTTNYTGAAQPYSCIAVFVDQSEHQVGLRSGRSGASGFGLLHALQDHGIDERTIELIIQDEPAGTLQSGTRFLYGTTFEYDGIQEISVDIIEDRASSTAAPDNDSLGVVTAYCTSGGVHAPEEPCPPDINEQI